MGTARDVAYSLNNVARCQLTPGRPTKAPNGKAIED